MVRLIVAQGIGKGEVTVLLAGDAVFTQVRELKNTLDALLAGCQHLTIDVAGLGRLDHTFRALICSLHRRSDLAHKSITLQGPLIRQEEPSGFSGACGCPRGTGVGCQLWDSLERGPGDAPAGIR